MCEQTGERASETSASRVWVCACLCKCPSSTDADSSLEHLGIVQVGYPRFGLGWTGTCAPRQVRQRTKQRGGGGGVCVCRVRVKERDERGTTRRAKDERRDERSVQGGGDESGPERNLLRLNVCNTLAGDNGRGEGEPLLSRLRVPAAGGETSRAPVCVGWRTAGKTHCRYRVLPDAGVLTPLESFTLPKTHLPEWNSSSQHHATAQRLFANLALVLPPGQEPYLAYPTDRHLPSPCNWPWLACHWGRVCYTRKSLSWSAAAPGLVAGWLPKSCRAVAA